MGDVLTEADAYADLPTPDWFTEKQDRRQAFIAGAAWQRRQFPEWQPIETAPLDGTEVLLGLVMATSWVVRNGWYDDPEDGTPAGWWGANSCTSESLLHGPYEPTCWMPLPKEHP